MRGFDPDEDPLAQTLALNLSVAVLEQAGGAVRRQGPQGLVNTARTIWRMEPVHGWCDGRPIRFPPRAQDAPGILQREGSSSSAYQRGA
jgi:hypothetical protein